MNTQIFRRRYMASAVEEEITSLDLAKYSHYFTSPTAGEIYITVKVNGNSSAGRDDVKVLNDAYFVTSAAFYKSNGKVGIKVGSNTVDGNEGYREGDVYVTCGSITKTIHISQVGDSYTEEEAIVITGFSLDSLNVPISLYRIYPEGGQLYYDNDTIGWKMKRDSSGKIVNDYYMGDAGSGVRKRLDLPLSITYSGKKYSRKTYIAKGIQSPIFIENIYETDTISYYIEFNTSVANKNCFTVRLQSSFLSQSKRFSTELGGTAYYGDDLSEGINDSCLPLIFGNNENTSDLYFKVTSSVFSEWDNLSDSDNISRSSYFLVGHELNESTFS